MNTRTRHTAWIWMAAWLWAAAAAAQPAAEGGKQGPASRAHGRTHQVQPGEFLGGIAARYRVSIASIMRENGLKDPDKIFAGMTLRIPDANAGVVITVPKGVTLSRIAKVYNVKMAAILRANPHVKNPDALRAGQRLRIPGVDKVVELVPPPPCYAPAVEFYRVKTDETRHIHLTFCNGKPNPKGVAELSELSKPVYLDEVPFPLHPRLAVLLQQVADHYPGRRIEIISGQRLRKQGKRESYHTKGQAIDFRVAGVPNRELMRFARTLDRTGVGYYPNSVFIHMDTRERSAFWIDYSGIGEKPIYARAGLTPEQVEAIRAQRRKAHRASDAAQDEAETVESGTEHIEAPAPVVAAAPEAPEEAPQKEPQATPPAPAQEPADDAHAG